MNQTPKFRLKKGAYQKLLRPFPALGLLFLAFLTLAASDPAITFVAAIHGQQTAFFTPENRFTARESPLDITIVSAAHAGSVRARFSSCPANLPGCLPDGKPFRLELPGGQVTLHFADSAKPLTLDVQRALLHPFYVLFLVFLGGALFLLIRGREERLLTGALLATCGLYFSQTLGQNRGLDVSGHLAHVQKITTDGFFVKAQACWECFQPPLYYALSSLLLGFPAILRPSSATVLQGLALLLHCLCVPLVVAALRPSARSQRELLTYSALTLLWPAAVLGSVRLGNDALLNLCAFAVVALLLNGRLLTAAAVAGISLLVKQSGITLIALVAAWGCVSAFRARQRFGAGALLAAGLVLSRLMSRLKEFDPARMNALAEPLQVQNTFSNVALPNPVSFLMQPFVNPWIPSGNREHLVNYFWKTSLFGEWAYTFPLAPYFALALSLALVAVVGSAAFAWWRAGRPLFPALLLAISFGAVTGYRLRYPYTTNADFRFAYPAAALGISICLARGRIRHSPLVVLAFLFLSELTFVFHWWFEA